ncbi:MAG: hypothetical protein GTO18_14180 [Anaerolineales bacterium]|nr:hypothetical protein [Anaerolineales bacterium]
MRRLVAIDDIRPSLFTSLYPPIRPKPLRSTSSRIIVRGMEFPDKKRRGNLHSVLQILLWGMLLGIAYSQSPLYTSNQNQYFLHGIADSGFGFMSDDWLANTIDPTPVFSMLVHITTQFLDERLFYLFFLLLFSVHIYSLWSITDRIYDLKSSPVKSLLFLTLIFILHSALLRSILAHVISRPWEYIFDAGVAGQRLLGPVLQPSTFGVFLLLSIERFLRGKPYQAVLAACLAATMHPTYLLSAAVLTFSYMVITFREKGIFKDTLSIGALAMVLILPILAYIFRSFLPTSPAAQEILVNFRIPVHAIPSQWFDLTVIVKGIIILLAMILVRDSRLFVIMLISAALAVALTFLQIILGDDGLALLFPWRISTYLVPLGSAILAAQLVSIIVSRVHGWTSRHPSWVPSLSLLLIGLTVITGLVVFWIRLEEKRTSLEQSMYAFVSANVSEGDQYMVPPKMQDFRLETGAPIVADLKSIPYKGSEVLEWYERVRHLQWFYRDQPEYVDCALLYEAVEDYSVTHVVLGPDQRGLACEGMVEVYEDGMYGVYVIGSQ